LVASQFDMGDSGFARRPEVARAPAKDIGLLPLNAMWCDLPI
jgi:hypothetical protein